MFVYKIGRGMEYRSTSERFETVIDFITTSAHVAHPENLGYVLQE